MAEIKLNGMPVEACLLDYVEGRLSAEEARTVEAFLAEHAEWTAQVALLREPMPVSAEAASAVADGVAAEDLAAGLTCPPELKARLLRPADGRVLPVRSVRPAWFAWHVRRRTYQAAAAVAGLLLVVGIVWRTADERVGGRPADGTALSASVDAVAMVDAEAVLSMEAGLTGAVLSAEPRSGQGMEAAVAEVRQATVPTTVAAVEGAVSAASTVASATVAVSSASVVAVETADNLPRAICAVQPLQGGRLSAERLEIGGSEPALLARVSTEAAAGFSEEVEARRSRFEPDALIAQAYVALARRIERQRIRREIKREVTASLQADAEMQPAFWHI